jgi:hypothetical protein
MTAFKGLCVAVADVLRHVFKNARSAHAGAHKRLLCRILSPPPLSAWTSVAVRSAPIAPAEWPKEMAPPIGLNFVRSKRTRLPKLQKQPRVNQSVLHHSQLKHAHSVTPTARPHLTRSGAIRTCIDGKRAMPRRFLICKCTLTFIQLRIDPKTLPRTYKP